MNLLEEGNELSLDFHKISEVSARCPDVIPVAVQNIDTKEVILIAYLNDLALQTALRTRTAVFWSTTRNELWEKGKTSGETYELCEVLVNCEQNSLVFQVRPRRGGICHTQNSQGQPRNCYYRKLNWETGKLDNINP